MKLFFFFWQIQNKIFFFKFKKRNKKVSENVHNRSNCISVRKFYTPDIWIRSDCPVVGSDTCRTNNHAGFIDHVYFGSLWIRNGYEFHNEFNRKVNGVDAVTETYLFLAYMGSRMFKGTITLYMTGTGEICTWAGIFWDIV